jgi:hypothetical protein
MSSAHAPSASSSHHHNPYDNARRRITSAGSALAVPLCSASRPIEEMPRGDVAGFWLAASRMSYVSAAFRSASLRNWAPAGVAPLGLG